MRLTTTFPVRDGQAWLDGWRDKATGVARFSLRIDERGSQHPMSHVWDDLDWATAYDLLVGRTGMVADWLRTVTPKT